MSLSVEESVPQISSYPKQPVLYARLHGANKSILFAQILDPYVVTLSGFAQIKRVLFAHVY